MRFTLLTIVSILIIFCALGQTSAVNDKMIVQITDLYNKEAYKEIYALSSVELKSQISEDQMTAFYKNNIRASMGKIISWKAQAAGDGAQNYTVQFEKGKLDITFYINSKNEITGVQWLPSKANTELRKKDVSAINTNNPKHTELELIVDSLAVDYLQQAATCGLEIGIISGDKSETFFYGGTDKKNNKLPGFETLYEIGSITKTFTGILLAHAINEGKMKAEDDIRKYLPGEYPDLQFNGIPITIQDLSNHTSGLPRIPADLDKQPHYNENDPYKNYSKEMMYAYLKKLKIKKLPGTKSEYSNFGVALLGVIIENVYKESLENLVRRYITGSVRMDDTKFNLSSDEMVKMATGYDGITGAVAGYWNLGAFNGCGGLKSDMPDMLEYLKANMNEINSDFKLSHQQTYKDEKTAIGLNWMLTTTKNDKTLIWHNGGTVGFRSFCGYIKEKKVGVVILSNSGMDTDGIAINILKKLTEE